MHDISWSIDEYLDEALDWELWRRAAELALREDETAGWLRSIGVESALQPHATRAEPAGAA